MTEMDSLTPIRRLGVIGDVHAEADLLGRALNILTSAGVDCIVCTGDIADGPGCINTCCALLKDAAVLSVAGNHDRWLLANRVRHIDDAHVIDELTDVSLEYLTGLTRTLELETIAGTALLCHGVAHNDMRKVWPGTERMRVERSAELDTIIGDGEHRFVINGHLHYRCVIHFEALTLINAGTIFHRHRPGVSVVDFDDGSVAAYELLGDQRGTPVAEKRLAPDRSRRIWRDTQEFDGAWTPTVLYRD